MAGAGAASTQQQQQQAADKARISESGEATVAEAIQSSNVTFSQIASSELGSLLPVAERVEVTSKEGAYLAPSSDMVATGGAQHAQHAAEDSSGSDATKGGRDLFQLSFALVGGFVVFGLWQCSRGKRLLLLKRRGGDSVRRRLAP